MAFELEPTRTPVSIGNVVVILKDAVASGEQPASKSAHFEIKVLLSDGTTVQRRGDLVPHLTPQQVQGLLNFMNDLRAQAATQILGT